MLRSAGSGMNIEAYDTEALRKIVRLLEYENRLLKDKLKKENIPYDEINPFEETIENAEEYDLDQGARIVHPTFITEKMAIRFFSMFWGREDAYAKRGKNGGYFPQCDNRWNMKLCPKQRGEKIFCDECENKKWTKLDVKKIVAHLLGYKEDGSDVIGVYPLLPDGTCRFIVFDFVKTDVVGKFHMVLSNGVYVDILNLMPRIQNQIRSLAAFDNPEYYKNKRLGYSNYYNFSAVYLGKDIDGYIRVPRGLRERITEECAKAGIQVEISDQRGTGRPIRVSFNGNLRLQQELAAEQLLRHSDGVLEAATAFGKTVVCSYLIAERKVNTLILLQSKDLLSQWVEELNKFLGIKEEPPEYETKTGRKKKRDSAIGILHGSITENQCKICMRSFCYTQTRRSSG